MKRKTIGRKSAEFLKILSEKNQQFFDTNGAAQLTNASLPVTRDFLSELADRGLILRIKPGKFYVIPYNLDSESYLPNWHLIAGHLVNGLSYIGYYSALEIYELITQPSLVETIVINRTLTKSELILKDVSFKFIYHNDKHFFGYEDVWIDDNNQVKVSNLEKTFIDCLFKPEYAGGILETIKAIYKAKNQLSWEKFKEYIIRFDSKAVNKRLGYALDTLNLEPVFQEFLLDKLGKAHTTLDPTLPEKGTFISKWKLYANIDEESIQESLYT